jgi:hypothetical protein
MTRRPLRFDSLADLRRELQSLAAQPYQRAGNWSLGQVCQHLRVMIDMSMDGYPMRVGWHLRMLAPVMRFIFARMSSMPAGLKGPADLMPAAAERVDEHDHEQLQLLLATLDRYEAFSEPLKPSPLLGRLSRAQWDRLHRIHAAHHLSFIVPTSRANLTAVTPAGG